MIDPVRGELLEVLAELSAIAPDVRFGQMLTNLAYQSRGLRGDAAWEAEDRELLRAAKAHLVELEASVAPSITANADP